MVRSFANRIYESIFPLIVGGQSPVLSFPTAFMPAREMHRHVWFITAIIIHSTHRRSPVHSANNLADWIKDRRDFQSVRIRQMTDEFKSVL